MGAMAGCSAMAMVASLATLAAGAGRLAAQESPPSVPRAPDASRGASLGRGPRASVDTAARRQAMQKLAFLVGEWSGPAWAMMGPGQRMEMRQTEKVRYALGGQVLLVEGIGQRVVNGVPTDTVFHAAATVDWLPDRGYLMRSYTLGGHFGEYPLELADRGFVWQAPAPGGKVTYTMRLTDDGTWDERGVYEGNGRTIPVVQLTVKKR